MPVAPTYPGVYIDELPSSVRTIVGVPTAVTAFVGPAPRGPANEARHITNWGDYERIYGGLSAESPMSHAVYQFYLNGGSHAEIVRVIEGGSPATLTLDPTGANIAIQARYSGTWGDELRARVDHDTKVPASPDLWNLTIRDWATGDQEVFRNIDAATPSTNPLEQALANSRLVTFKGPNPAQPAENTKSTAADPFADVTPADPQQYAKGTGGGDSGPLKKSSYVGNAANKTGMQALLTTDIFNLLVVPPPTFTPANPPSVDLATEVLPDALELCVDRRAILLVDGSGWTDLDAASKGIDKPPVSGNSASNAAMYFPDLVMRDPQTGVDRAYGPSASVAGVVSRTDTQRGVWKAPAGQDASISAVRDLSVKLTDLENGLLNPRGLNCIRTFPVIGTVVWGSRTLRGADSLADQWKYLPVRRTALYIEESLYRGTKWAVFEPNDEPLWASLRLNIGAFMNSLYRQGAFAGSTPREAYLVKCDRENNPDNDINRGIVNILVGFKPLQPAEFVIIHIQQLAGQLET